jgi:hypothetical protein
MLKTNINNNRTVIEAAAEAPLTNANIVLSSEITTGMTTDSSGQAFANTISAISANSSI